ncbi:MAG: PspA/IM30 family protein [Deltaproteobacteria bacterium]|nr:PspA/IM30 family protein [Deltaproteobacteria bacterium]
MGIFDRMGQVISSNVNALLDKAEDPRKSVELAIEEMSEALRQAKQEIVEALGAQKRLGSKSEELDKEIAKWEQRAELALKSNDEPLAREALKQKKRLLGERERAETVQAEQRGIVLTMKREMERMEAKLSDLKARKTTVVNELSRAKRAAADPTATARPGGAAFDKFREMEDKIEQQRSQVSAYSEVEEALRDGRPSEADLEARFAELEGRGVTPTGGPSPDGVDDEIARLKKKLRIEG